MAEESNIIYMEPWHRFVFDDSDWEEIEEAPESVNKDHKVNIPKEERNLVTFEGLMMSFSFFLSQCTFIEFQDQCRTKRKNIFFGNENVIYNAIVGHYENIQELVKIEKYQGKVVFKEIKIKKS